MITHISFHLLYVVALCGLASGAMAGSLPVSCAACALMIALESGQDLFAVGIQPAALKFLGRASKEGLLFAVRHGLVSALLVLQGLHLVAAYYAIGLTCFYLAHVFWATSARL